MPGTAVGAVLVPLLAVVAIVPTLPVGPAMGLELALVLLGLRLRGRLQPLEHLGRGGEVRRQRRHRNALARRPLDIAQVATLIRAAESDGNAVGAGARGA